MLFFQSFKAGPLCLFLYPTVQDTLVQLMLINIGVGPELSKPWAFGIPGAYQGTGEKSSGAGTAGGALSPRQKEPAKPD